MSIVCNRTNHLRFQLLNFFKQNLIQITIPFVSIT